MTICPIAILAGCRKCPAYSVCPLKNVLGDAGKVDENARAKPAAKTSSRSEAGSKRTK